MTNRKKKNPFRGGFSGKRKFYQITVLSVLEIFREYEVHSAKIIPCIPGIKSLSTAGREKLSQILLHLRFMVSLFSWQQEAGLLCAAHAARRASREFPQQAMSSWPPSHPGTSHSHPSQAGQIDVLPKVLFLRELAH